jgi:hypothetical protein
LFNFIKNITKETELFDARVRLSDPPPYTRNFERARRREFHPLELILAKAAPQNGGQPGH